MSRRGAASIVASPVLVGAVTVLVSAIAVILSYNASKGLPFVPRYTVSATLPGGANLVEGNEVRVGGFRVGIVDRMGTQMVKNSRGEDKAVAVIRMDLDKVIEELPLDTKVIVRPRSALGLKYVELTPGSSEKTFRPGSTIPLKNAEGPVELDDVLNTFQDDVRDNSQSALDFFGIGLSGRGPSINEALHDFVPFFQHLSPVMRSLSAPHTELDRFFLEIGQTTADIARSCDQGSGPRRLPGNAAREYGSALDAASPACGAPVAVVQARLFSEMADTFAAFGRDPAALRQFIEDTAPTNYESIASFRVQKPFLADFAEFSRRLEPAAEELPRALPKINDALVVGTDVLPRTVELNENTEDLLKALEELAENPNTLLALKDLTQTVRVGAPFVEYVAPYQTVCNYFTLYWTDLGEHLTEEVEHGQLQRVMIKTGPFTQDDRINDFGADRPADVPKDMDPQEAQEGDQEQFKDIQDELEKQIDDLQKVKDDLADGDPTDADIPEQFQSLLGPGNDSFNDLLPGFIPGTDPPPDVQAVIDAVNDALDELIDRLQDQLDQLNDAARNDLTSLHGQAYLPAIDGEGNADCQSGQLGFLDRLITTGRYPPSNDPEKNGGSHVVVDSNTPGLAGPTFSGVPSLKDVDSEQRSRHPRGEVPDDRPQKPNARGVVPGESGGTGN